MTDDLMQAIYHEGREDVLTAFDDAQEAFTDAYQERYGTGVTVDRAEARHEITARADGTMTGREYTVRAAGRRGVFLAAVRDRPADERSAVPPERDLVVRYRAGDPGMVDRAAETAADLLDEPEGVERDQGREYRFTFPYHDPEWVAGLDARL